MDDGSQTVSQEILDAVRGGDQGASRTLIDMLYPQVIAIVRNHLPRSEGEEDIVQDVFMKVFSKMKSYAGKQPFPHWVSRIALNTCYDRLRRQKRRRVIGFSELGVDETEFLELAMIGGEAPRSRECGPALARELLDKLFESLKPRERMVVRARRKLGETLARLEGRSEQS